LKYLYVMRYYLIAGEKSGDVHGGFLIKAIKHEDKNAVFRSWGGNCMQQAGGNIVIHYTKLALMGLHFLGSLMRLRRYLKYCQKDILDFQPDVVILIDYAGFNLRVAQFAKKHGIQTFYYISPKIWAWNAGRIRQIKAYVDRMFVIFPFEQNFYNKYNYLVDYVGNPLIEQTKLHQVNPHFKSLHSLDQRQVIALMPGSRVQEIERVLPVMLDLATKLPNYQFVLAALSELPPRVYQQAHQSNHIQVIYNQAYDLLAHAYAAIVTSGTATLEAAYFQVPQIVVYKTDVLTYILARCLLQLKYISLVNILAGKKVVPELIQQQCQSASLLQALQPLLEPGSRARKNQLASYRRIQGMLGDKPASKTAAQLMVKYLVGP
jgi:lipid-A-disaccharide synthase